MTQTQEIKNKIENLDFIRTTHPDGTEFLEVKRADLEALLAQTVKETEERVREYADKKRTEVDEGTYCKNEGERWANGYDCAMYDILQNLTQPQND